MGGQDLPAEQLRKGEILGGLFFFGLSPWSSILSGFWARFKTLCPRGKSKTMATEIPGRAVATPPYNGSFSQLD